MDFNAVAVALESAAKQTGINALDYVPDALPSAAFYVGEIDVEYDLTFRPRRLAVGTDVGVRRGTDTATITCRVLVARSTDKHAVRKMRDYMSGSGTRSIVDAISADKTLNGTVHSSQVKRARGNRLFQVGEARFYGVEIDVFVVGDA